MKISLEHIGKRFLRYWIFKDVHYEFAAGGRYVLLGANGSGKSTLLRVISGMQSPSQGKVVYYQDDRKLEHSKVFPLVSFCAPGMELVEEFTLREFLDFHFSFKQPLPGIAVKDMIGIMGLEQAADKQIGDFSSGMKQRVKLAQAIFAHTPILLLDEPCTNLDERGVQQYQQWLQQYTQGRLLIVASNDPREYVGCDQEILVEQYK